MAHFRIIVVGKLKDKRIEQLCMEYMKRLSRFCKAEVLEIKDSDPKREGDRIVEILQGYKGTVYVATEEGTQRTSVEFSRELETDLARGTITFVVGGPHGLSEAVKARSGKTLSLSAMTFTHEMARLLLIEQLYRAKNISANTGYHH